ncbi:helix-turn-helix domain-containing protein [Leptospira sp. 2 VSF19]|uniref:Helix-turn-helix domain-containing protein n=1 Tax=Leptospira soteropolitanensis TaxID=2950025 RepID=A0AAW5VDY7_9LEPT|nr:helix-turn-helix domain-containing protein [Leptospira soteropolitanensis]MCW7491046.1 helix-turn-helix domain-containing protein [Leptospira soteropolitanensis]MCW7498630.1 helix-turn-helix domain-containing protein [Leptospira soteropolitanensis]MCW7521777.1 helix-turn-helix domain-containing protein [Leptospira soteropolitanensis]MCW7524734.1 helix-turn-helix domain-containing protein [Leptospira soteropolitanensis]MCW7528601.1 helix-turn-helix domain-containing protein [Leptospira soter
METTSLSLTLLLEFLWMGSGSVFCLIWSFSNLIRNRNVHGFVWSFVLFSTGLWLLTGAFMFTGFHQYLPSIALIHIPFVFLSSTLLYLYLEYLFLEKPIQIRIYHFIPAIVSVIFLIPYFLESNVGKLEILNHLNKTEYGSVLVGLNFGIKISILLSVGIFLIKEWIPNVRLSVFFTKKAVYSLIFILLIWIDLLLGSIGFTFQFPFFRKLSAYLLPVLMYFYYFTRELWAPFVSDVRDSIQRNKYEKSKLVSVQLETIDQRLYELMREKVFCDEDLSLSRLAEMAEVKPGQLSEYFHKRYGFGFYQYINQYRIDEAKRLLLESEERSILSIADSVGFNSKSTFNRVFLETVGSTPSEFRKQSKLT